MITVSKIDTLNIGLTIGLVCGGLTTAATFAFIVLLVVDTTVDYLSEVMHGTN